MVRTRRRTLQRTDHNFNLAEQIAIPTIQKIFHSRLSSHTLASLRSLTAILNLKQISVIEQRICYLPEGVTFNSSLQRQSGIVHRVGRIPLSKLLVFPGHIGSSGVVGEVKDEDDARCLGAIGGTA